MISVFTSTYRRLALSAAAFGLAFSITPAPAADLDGDCCADLEERVAELEATTARKENRKVSLAVSGWVNEQVLWWDDGSERNVYVGTNKLEQSRVRFVGEAQIAPGYSAGYTLELGTVDADSTKWSQDGLGGSGPITVRKSYWWLKSKDLGKITVGLEGTATYHLLDDADSANTRNFSDAQATGPLLAGFFLRSGGAPVNGLHWGDVMRGVDNQTPGQDGRRNIVRYDSPEIAGFVATAAWGEDDIWGVSLAYKNLWGDFAVLAKVGYGQNSDENTEACSKSVVVGGSVPAGQDCEIFGAAGTIMHVPTGLYVYGGYGRNHDNSEAATANTDPIDAMWFIQGGIERKWMPLGITTIFGEYRHDDAGSNLGGAIAGAASNGNFIQSSKLNFWGAGVIQHLDAAEMDLYFVYHHADGDVTNFSGALSTVKLDDFDALQMGALIKF